MRRRLGDGACGQSRASDRLTLALGVSILYHFVVAMEHVQALTERIKSLKAIATSMVEGAVHTHLVPAVDMILALPDELASATMSEREAIGRQVREFEQAFDRLGYTLLDQIMPATGVSPVFRVVAAANACTRQWRSRLGQSVLLGERELVLDRHHLDVLSRYSLSIGTPPTTADMRELVARVLFGVDVAELYGYLETLSCDRRRMQQLFDLLRELVDSSLHYATQAEETDFLRAGAKFINFEGASLFNRVVITESPERAIQLIKNHVFDKFGADEMTPVRLVEGVDRLDMALVTEMRAEPNCVFVAEVTRIPHTLFFGEGTDAWQSVVGRLLLIDVSARARHSNTTIVYTLFPHVARTLRNVQTSFAGRPANTQLTLRRILEQFPSPVLADLRAAVAARLVQLEEEGALAATVEQLRAQDWQRNAFIDHLTLAKLERLLAFLETLAVGDEVALAETCASLRDSVARDWMCYFYSGLDPAVYRATVLPGGGRGALKLVGEYHREQVRAAVTRFRATDLAACRERLRALKADLNIPTSSSDEIEAAIKQSQLRALAPAQWRTSEEGASLGDHLSRTLLYRVADVATRLTRRAEQGLDHAAFGNVTGGTAAFVKRAMAKAGLGALHGHLEEKVGERVHDLDRKVRGYLAPVQEAVRSAQHAIEDVKGDLDPIAVGEIEAVLQVIERGTFYPTLILPEMAWTYHDVFPEKDFPRVCTMRIAQNERYELDPEALLAHLLELRSLFRRFPEIFRLFCSSMLLVVNTPHNPTGVVYRRETVLRLLQIAAEYDIAICDDNSYHKLVTREHKAREGDACVAQIFEQYKEHLGRPVRIYTAGATTKALQGAGDRTGLLHSSVTAVVDYAESHASLPHLMSLYMTRAKLESGLAVKRYTRALEALAVEMLRPGEGAATPWACLEALLASERATMCTPGSPVAAFLMLLGGYEDMLRLRQRGASLRELSASLSDLVRRLKSLRLEQRLRDDLEARLSELRAARARAMPDTEYIESEGAFYACVRLCAAGDDRGVVDFLEALARHRKVDLTYAGRGFVRISLGGALHGDALSYARFGKAVELYLGLLARYWQKFDAGGRDVGALAGLFVDAGADPLAAALVDLEPLWLAHPAAPRALGQAVDPSEQGTVFCIEEGKSIADKVFVTDADCRNVEQLLQSRAFRVVYRRLLKKVYRRHAALADASFEQAENQYGPLCCLAAYHDRQLIDEVFRQVLVLAYREWHGHSTIKVLLVKLNAERHSEKVAALHGINRKINDLINELMHAFDVAADEITASSTFAIGCEAQEGISANDTLPPYLCRIIEGTTFAGATSALDPKPSYVTGAAKRVADVRYGFDRRDADEPARGKPPLAFFRQRLAFFAELADLSSYVCKAEQVGPFKMLVVVHKSCFHLVNDALRLFPQIEEVQQRERLSDLAWDGVMLFGVPSTCMGESFRTGYVLDRRTDGALLPTAWISREDACDYVGFFKKTLLTLHNERVKAMGGLPVHGSMITITFKNGLRKTLVFSADSGTGKSETITAMMEQLITGDGLAAEMSRIDILAGDMLSLWRGEDAQVYGFGTESGDFLRLTDITESWKARFGDLLERGSYSNLDHPTNPRVTIPGICDAEKLLTPTRVNGFFYINNYERPAQSAVELSEDPHHVLRHILVRGLRKNKGTSGDQPSLRAGLERAGESALVTRYRHTIDELLAWQQRELEGRLPTCLCYRDGAGDVFAAAEVVNAAFRGKRYVVGEVELCVSAVEFDVLRNVYWLRSTGGHRHLLAREIYDQIYEPLVSTFCGNPFVEPAGLDRTLETFAETMRLAKVHTGVIKTQLAREGYEFLGPAKAARDTVRFLLEDEEVNARFQRNKDKVQQAMDRTFSGVLESGSNLPVELEGYNLLLLEAHESTHVAFRDLADHEFTFATPYYRFLASANAGERVFVPAIARPEMIEAVRDICGNPVHDLDLSHLHTNLADYERIRFWNSREELIYQVLLVNGVVGLGAAERQLTRFPAEVRKAERIAEEIMAARKPVLGATVAALRAARS